MQIISIQQSLFMGILLNRVILFIEVIWAEFKYIHLGYVAYLSKISQLAEE